MNYKPSSWDLAVITPDSIAKASTIIEEKAKGIETKKKLLTNSITSTTFMNIIIEYESLRQEMEKLGIYAHLKFCENSNDQKAVAVMSQVESFLTKAGNRLLFLTHWFKKLPDEKAQELINASNKYRYYFETLRKNNIYIYCWH